MEPLDIKALIALKDGRKPTSGRKFSPESVRRRSVAHDLADITDSDVSEPVREWIEALQELVDAAETALTSIEEASSNLRDAEDGDDRETTYQELDEGYNELVDALESLGIVP